MAAFRLRDAVEIDDHRIKVHWLLAALALVAITAGLPASQPRTTTSYRS
jgi:hypothetical protein